MAERYLLGHMEEKVGDVEIMSPQSVLGAALLGKTQGDVVEYTTPTGQAMSVQILKVESA